MIGQKVGIGEMSIQTAMQVDPLIMDPELEMSRINQEGLRKSLLNGLEQQAVQGQLDPNTIARIVVKMGDGSTTLEEAVVAVHKEVQKEQADQQDASVGSVPGAAVPGGMGGMVAGGQESDPNAQPGLAAGAMAPGGAQPGVATIAPPAQGLDNLKSLLGSLHTSSPPPMAAAG